VRGLAGKSDAATFPMHKSPNNSDMQSGI
jgi:hypothetical protein